ncbi:MAG TPA: isoprenylcysteine carboxylmethyltransferase family protein [Vicinamibacterales bacterium]|nr:isoprenylcysteine carboxylmethyltransferase family protein [Vicinamibacterales bacterium]
MRPLPFTGLSAIPFWIAFYWAFAAEMPFVRRDRVTAPASTDRGSKRVIYIAGGAGTFLAFLFASLLPALTMSSFRMAIYAAGIAGIAAGGWLRRHCFRMLGESFTYDVRVRDGQTVVERGAYRYVRHPSYAAGMLLFGGIGLSLTNWLSLAVAVIPPAVAYAYRISVEERALVATLGPAYADYMRRTKRLVPFLV